MEKITHTNCKEWTEALNDGCILKDANLAVKGMEKPSDTYTGQKEKLFFAVRCISHQSVAESTRAEILVG